MTDDELLLSVVRALRDVELKATGLPYDVKLGPELAGVYADAVMPIIAAEIRERCAKVAWDMARASVADAIRAIALPGVAPSPQKPSDITAEYTAKRRRRATPRLTKRR